ncbi:MAG TPA: penicillin-binding transpeptidase domain-containing protein, partial [Chthoniobacteraceae bacterium]|nr:penicillin-binding transpeptidase domain-containing protein [Chthoniobacteraceae bacterium]
VAFVALIFSLAALAQGPDDALIRAKGVAVPEAKSSAAPAEGTMAPTWETQKRARTYLLGISAPRGQIVDRNGQPLAQTRVSYNLAVPFPTPLELRDHEVGPFVQRQAAAAQSILGRAVTVSPEQALKHYKNRGVLPFVIAQDLKPGEVEAVKRASSQQLVLQPTYQRFYPNGALAGHVVGYAGRTGRIADGVLQNNDLLWPGAEGREGLEQAFDDQLQGKVGQLNISFDATGKKASEQVTIPPQPGYNVVTTLDENIQRLSEDSLAKGCKRGAIVILDPNNGDLLALASWPPLNPNAFIPSISVDDFRALQEDKNIPLLPRAFRSAYPPGSTFKVFVGLAALNSGKVGTNENFSCPPSLEIGGLTFRNWKKADAGSLNFAEALTQSCNTWFYQCGMRVGPKLITDYAARVGLGQRTGIPLNAEAEGRVMTDEYMVRVYKRHLFGGDVANLSIGQGDTLITPLQMAQAMGTVGNGGTLYQTRLVSQVQSIDGQIVTAYNVRARGQIDINDDAIREIRRGMISVVESRNGTAGKAQVDGVHIAGKTGTAQWGPKNNERTAAWFAGYAPAEKPRYAFAALYEGDANNADVHGGTFAAPLIGRVMKELFKDEPKKKRGKKSDDDLADAAPATAAAAAPDAESTETTPLPAPRATPIPARRPLFPAPRPNAH